MRFPILLLVPLVVALAGTAPAARKRGPRDPGTARLSADTENRWIVFDLTPGNQIRFAMLLDGKPVVAILDTGVSYSVLARGSGAIDAARLTPGGRATAIGGSVSTEWMPTTSVALGGLTRFGGGVTVADLPAIATGSVKPVDILVGRDMIGDQALDIDYANHRFRLLPSGRLPFEGETAPLAISVDRRVYESEIALGGARLRPMVIDTGDGSSVTVTLAGWHAAAIADLPMTSAISFGLAGPVVSDMAIVPELRLGQLAARNVEVRIEAAKGFSQVIGVAGRIGSGFLQHYRVLLDPGAGRMVLAPGPSAGAVPLRSTSGLLVGVLSDRLRVLHVMHGGPAEAAGWKDGDTICAIDGTPIPPDYSVNPLAAWSVAKPGTAVKLGLCDGTTRSLTLRQFY